MKAGRHCRFSILDGGSELVNHADIKEYSKTLALRIRMDTERYSIRLLCYWAIISSKFLYYLANTLIIVNGTIIFIQEQILYQYNEIFLINQ